MRTEELSELPPPESESDFFSNCLQFSPHCFCPVSKAPCSWENLVHESRRAICTHRPKSGQGRAVDFCQGELHPSGCSFRRLKSARATRYTGGNSNAESFVGIDMDASLSCRSLCLCSARASSWRID